MKVSFKLSVEIIAGLFCAFLSVSCATMKAESMKYPVYVTNSHVINLLPVQDTADPVDSLFLLSGNAGNTSFCIQAYMKIDAAGIFISLLNDFGTDMGSLSYTGEQLSFDSTVFPKSFKPQYIAADIQFTYYRPDAVRSVLRNSGLDFMVESGKDRTEIRKIMDGKKCIEEITKSAGSAKVVNYLRGYEYDVMEAEE
ncbi:MAG: DUF3261 domain-containing protein [Treponema sp.]|nr:DUF3261 domain-containing protein [Treponema sp.]